MVARLVLGCGRVGGTVLESVADWPGDLRVLTDEEGRASALREEGIDAVEAAPTDAEALPDRADVVFVAGDDVARNAEIVRAAREQFPDALVVAYPGDGAGDAAVDALRSLADRVIDPREALVERTLSVASGVTGERIGKLLGILGDVAGPLAVVAHDNPDPDAIASAVGLAQLAERFGVAADACYNGEISHQENRALVNLLDISMLELEPGAIDDYDAVALVDHSRPGVNDSLPEDTVVDIVVDHHPPRGPVEARYVDLRTDVGSTSTLVADYYDTLGIDPTRQVATALLYGIRIDTKDFTREADRMDFEVAADLLEFADVGTLDRVESPSVSPETFGTIARAIRNREIRDGALASCVGELRDRDALAQAAERLLDMEGIDTVLVYGFLEGTIYASGRSRGADLDLGETLRDAFGRLGSAGGHANMAGAQVPLGILGDVHEGSRESLADIVHDVVSSRFFEALRDAPRAPQPDDLLTLEYPSSGVRWEGESDDRTEPADLEGTDSDVDGSDTTGPSDVPDPER